MTSTQTTNSHTLVPFDQGEVKSNLDRAWVKIENARKQEAEGRKLWIEGPLELINILDDARKRLGSIRHSERG